MVYTKADKDKAFVVPEVVKDEKDDVYQQLKDLKPISNLDLEDFAKHLANCRNNPKDYSGIITGFFKRWRLERETKAVDLLTTYLEKCVSLPITLPSFKKQF